jgi:hypothetical protein
MTDEKETDELDEPDEERWEDEGGAGVHEPRRSPPSSGGSAAEAEPEREPELVGAAPFSASWYY